MDDQKSCPADSASASARAIQANLSALASPPQEYGRASASSSIALESGSLARGSGRGRTRFAPLPLPLEDLIANSLGMHRGRCGLRLRARGSYTVAQVCIAVLGAIALRELASGRANRNEAAVPDRSDSQLKRRDRKFTWHASRSLWTWATRSRLVYRRSSVHRRPRCHRAPRAG